MAAENSTETAALSFVPGRPFLPGQSGNPGGRPKGLAVLVKAQTEDGAELVDFMLKVLRNKRQPVRYRMEAAAWLADRGFGKAVQQVDVGNVEGEVFVFRIVDTRGVRDADARRLP